MTLQPEQHAQIYEWLEMASASKLLKGGQRRYDLLTYLVTEELEGRGDSLKGYSIALDVLGRGADFDPSTDSIVRVEVARLRDALELYIARSTDQEEPKITIPKGSYRPTIEIRSIDQPEERSRTLGFNLTIATNLALIALFLGVLVYAVFLRPSAEFENSEAPVVEIAAITADRSAPGYSFAQGFRQQLLADLAHLPTVTVRDGPIATDDVRRHAAANPVYMLTITPAFEGESGIIGLQLSAVAKATVVWNRAIPITDGSADFYSVLAEAVQGIAQEVAGPSGAITSDQASAALSALVERSSSRSEYQCLIVSLVFDATKDAVAESASRACLAEAVEKGTRNSTLLAMFALNQFFASAGIPGEHGEPSLETILLLERAHNHAQKAVQINPTDSFAFEVLGNILSALDDRLGAIDQYQRAVDLAPSRPAPHFLLGWQMALQGDWDNGVAKMQEGIDMQPNIPGYMIVPLALDAFRRSEYEQSLRYARAVIARGDPRGYSLAFAASLAMGNTEEADSFFYHPDARTSFDPSDPMREVRITFSNPDVMPKYRAIIDPYLMQLEFQ